MLGAVMLYNVVCFFSQPNRPVQRSNFKIKELTMRKLLLLALAVCVMFTTLALAQDNAAQSGGSSTAAAAPLKNIKGTVKMDGDKTVFVADKDQKSWEIINPDAVKGHEGHHVEVSAHVYADKGQIHVMSVKMLKSKSSM
jgi:hypothetical protein